MKITYDEKRQAYHIVVEFPETERWIGSNNITEVREEFIKHMAWLFDKTLCEHLKD